MTGFIESGYDPRDMKFIPDSDIDSESLPLEYDYNVFCDLTVKDQGSESTCVPTSISTMFEAMDYEPLDIYYIYDNRSNKPEEGMQIREALKFIQKNLNDSYFQYYRLNSSLQIQYSIVANGPCIFALPVRSNGYEFWKGSENLGGHAIACVGFNEEGFILQNSWGYNWGDNGLTILPYEEMNYVIEAWGIV